MGLGVAAGLVLFAGAARADDASAPQQAEWAQKYDADPKLEVQRSTVPVLSQQTVAATEQAIQTYQGIVSRGGWQPLPNVGNLHLGSKSQNVIALRQRLIGSGSSLNPDFSRIFT